MVRPVFIFDSREEWLPVGVGESLHAAGAALRGAKHPNEPPAAKRGAAAGPPRLDFPATMEPAELPPAVYHRRVNGGPLVWEQFWLWYLYNPWNVAGAGRHEGDWELVQYAHAHDPDTPLAFTASQHHAGGARDAWTVSHTAGRPVVYVARGSHAMYYSPGRHDFDICDGKGPRLADYEVRRFGSWATWPGRWGNSTGDGKSPESPGCQGIRWRAPHLYHSQSR